MPPTPGRADPPLPNLTVAQLEYLDAAVHAPTWAEAARRVGVTPSALSQGIAELERRLGLDLFEREGRRRAPTAAASEVVAFAGRVLAQTRDLARWADRTRGGHTGRLRLGMIDAAMVDHFPRVLHDFRRARPDVDLHLAVAPSGALLDDLSRGVLDLAVCVAPQPTVDGVTTEPLLDEPLAVYAPPGSRVGAPDTWGPWVTFPSGSRTRVLITQAVRAAGASFDVVAESNQPEVLREMVTLGLGWAVLPVVGAERGPEPLRRARRRPLAVRQIVAARRTAAAVDPAVDALLEALRSHAGRPPEAPMVTQWARRHE